ncbi:taste receptor type 2 member 9-like [Phyllobates terribilis]|uniref:taste receptor type 2 member 9-like n=1 Tax=Phyllobates terribilis TaxID=111132 RepID=UPI003CCB4078
MMADTLLLQFVIPAVVTFVPGMLLNSSIVFVYPRDWRNNVRSRVFDRIQFFMVICNTVLQSSMSMDSIVQCFNSYWLYNPKLSIYYFLRLVNVSNWFFLQIKALFSSRVQLLLLGSVIFSFVINLPLIWTFPKNVTEGSTVDLTLMNSPCWPLNMMLGSVLPAIFTLLRNGLSVLNLIRHVRRVKQNEHDFEGPPFNGHMNAARTMIIRVIADMFF